MKVFPLPIAALLVGAAVELCASPALARETRDARAAAREIEQSAALVRIELRNAREMHDAAATRCLSNKLSEVHAQLRLTRQLASLPEQTVSRDRRLQFAAAVARDRAHELARDARRCRARAPRSIALLAAKKR